MTNCNEQRMIFPAVKSKKVELSFDGGEITSDVGSMLLSLMDKKLGLTKKAAQLMVDHRQQSKVKHKLECMLKQRVFGIASGYEDLNDHDQLKLDPCFQTALGINENPASSPTLSRFENRADRKVAIGFHKLMVETMIQSYRDAPKELILDFDATDDRVHGHQEGRFYHGYYGHYCFLPLYVFCGDQLLVSYLRPANQDPAKHAGAILRLLVKRFRKEWPDVKIIFRGDSGFMRHRMFNWCEKHNVHYITGLAKNNILMSKALDWYFQAEYLFKTEHRKQRRFGEFGYQAGTWKRSRRVIVKAERNDLGPNTRFIVTNLQGDPQELYDKLYCQRGKMEQSIDEQISFFADRTSCSNWWANQFRLLLSSMAYVLVDTIRRTALKNTELEKARCATIRLKLFKVGAVIIRNTRRIRVLLSSSYPFKELFRGVYNSLYPS